MNTEPVLVEMGRAAEGAIHAFHLEAEHRADHVVDGLKFGDLDLANVLPLTADSADAPERPVDLLGAAGDASGMDMDPLLDREAGSVVDGRYGAPHCHAAGE